MYNNKIQSHIQNKKQIKHKMPHSVTNEHQKRFDACNRLKWRSYIVHATNSRKKTDYQM